MPVKKSSKNSINLLMLWGLIVFLSSSCAVFKPSEKDFTRNRSRMSEPQRRAYDSSIEQANVKTRMPGRPNSDNNNSSDIHHPEWKSGIPERKPVVKKSVEPPAENKVDSQREDRKGDITVEKKSSKLKNTRRLSREEIEERDEIAKIARKYEGVKYKYGGKNPFGFDCSGFVRYVFEKDEVYLPASARAQSSLGINIDLEDVVEGDLLFFGEDNKVDHVAIVTANDGKHIYIIHSTSSAGVIEEDLNQSAYWMERFLFAKDILGE